MAALDKWHPCRTTTTTIETTIAVVPDVLVQLVVAVLLLQLVSYMSHRSHVYAGVHTETYPFFFCICLMLLSSLSSDAPSRETGRRARPPANKRRREDNDDSRGNPRRQSLRVGTGKKGRGAELRQRRGSLRRRDRTAEREAKAAAAMERNTVNLPE